MDDLAPRWSRRWMLLLCVSVAAIIAAPVYLWSTNYCFAERRYIPRSEICEKFLSSFPSGLLTANSRCSFGPTGMAAFLVFPTEVSPHLYPQTQWGDLGRFYDSCGRTLKFH
jgi:hypothetical protein